jgi:hypothetical protein
MILLIPLVPVVVWLNLTLVHVISIFSLALTHHSFSSRLLHPVHNHISILSLSQHQHPTLNHFRIHFLTTKLRKQLYKKFKYDT